MQGNRATQWLEDSAVSVYSHLGHQAAILDAGVYGLILPQRIEGDPPREVARCWLLRYFHAHVPLGSGVLAPVRPINTTQAVASLTGPRKARRRSYADRPIVCRR